MSATQKIKRKPKVPTMAYFVCRLMIDPRTGEEVGCMVPSSQTDRAILRAKKIRIGDRIRMAPKKPRNEKFNRLVHGLGTLVRDQIEGFEHEDAHTAIKRLQADSGVMCETTHIDSRPVVAAILRVAESILGGGAAKMLAAVLPDIGRIPVEQPRSIAFDEMEEGEFHLFWQGICAHLVAKYWPALDADAIEAMIPMMPETPA